MREVHFRRAVGESTEAFLTRVLNDISDASMTDALLIADEFTVSNFDTSRTLDASTATAAQIADFVCTFIDDLQRRGSNRSQ